MVEPKKHSELGDYISISGPHGHIIGRVVTIGSTCIKLESLIMIPHSIVSSIKNTHLPKNGES